MTNAVRFAAFFIILSIFQANRKDLQRFLGLNDSEEMVYIRNVRKPNSGHSGHYIGHYSGMSSSRTSQEMSGAVCGGPHKHSQGN